MVNRHRDFITAYQLTCTEPRFAEALERKFMGFIGNGKQHAGRREAFEITREGYTCIIKLSNKEYVSDLASFLHREVKDGTIIQTIDPTRAQENIEEYKRRIGSLEEQLSLTSDKIERLGSDYTAVEKRATDLTRTNEELTIIYQQTEERYKRERTDLNLRLTDLETALANKDSFDKEIEQFKEIEKTWKKVKECIGERELEEIIAITREGSEAYLKAQIPNYKNMEKLGGREQILAEKGRAFEETDIHQEIQKAEGIIKYYDRLKKYFTEDGMITDAKAAVKDLAIPEALLQRLFATTKEEVPKYEVILSKREEAKRQHQQKQGIAESLERLEKEYQDIANIRQKIERILETNRTIALELKLLGEDTENIIFEGRLPLQKTNAETELGRTLQLCMLATITDKENFPGLEYSEIDNKNVTYQFKLPKTNAQTALQTTHTLAERMTTLLGETDFGLAGGKLRILYSGIIGELPTIETEQRPVITIKENTPKVQNIELNQGSKILSYEDFIKLQDKEAGQLGIYLPTIEDLNLSQRKEATEGTKLNHLGAREIILAMAETGRVRSKKIAPYIKERIKELYGFHILEEKERDFRYSSRMNGWLASLSTDFIKKLDNFIRPNPCFNVTERIIKRDLKEYNEEDRKLLYTFKSKIPLGLHTVRQAIEYEKMAEERISAGESFSPGESRSILAVKAARVFDHYVILDILKKNPTTANELLYNVQAFLPMANEEFIGRSLHRLRKAKLEDRLERRIGVLHR
ncbi:MAG: hypothetical protein Q8R18_03335 [bacterium]|nr:hypothetical protein [bacterium]